MSLEKSDLHCHISDNRNRLRKQLQNKFFIPKIVNNPKFKSSQNSSPQTEESVYSERGSPYQQARISPDVVQDFNDHYDLGKTIGEGAHAIVKLAYKKNQQNQVYAVNAVKIFRTDDSELVNAIRQSYQIGRLIQHQSIARVRELYINENTGYCHLVMKYYPYPSLETKLNCFKENESLTRELFIKLLDAVAFMHHQGICHRDLKPENILLNITQINGQLNIQDVVILDLGVSKRFMVSMPGTKKAKLKEMWTATGTLLYRAPETFLGGGYTKQIDIWALGIIMYQCLTGSLPFQDDTVSGSIELIIQANLDFKHQQTQITQFAKNIIQSMLSSDSKKRPRAKDLQRDIWFHIPASKQIKDDIQMKNTLFNNSSLCCQSMTQSQNTLKDYTFQTDFKNDYFQPKIHLTQPKQQNGFQIKLFKTNQSNDETDDSHTQ